MVRVDGAGGMSEDGKQWVEKSFSAGGVLIEFEFRLYQHVSLTYHEISGVVVHIGVDSGGQNYLVEYRPNDEADLCRNWFRADELRSEE